MQRPSCPCDHRQHYSGGLHKVKKVYETRVSLCPLLETLVLVQPQANLPEGLQHIWPLRHDSRQALSSQAGHSDGMVRSLGGFKQVCLGGPIPR